MRDIGMSSRGALDEYLEAFGDKLHTEKHLTEAMASDPENADKVAPILDAVRTARQELITILGKNNIDPRYHCSLKHATEDYRRVQELLENAARIDPESVIKLARLAKKSKENRDKIAELFLNGDKNASNLDDNACVRCFDDLNLNPSEVIVKKIESNPDECKDNKCGKKKALLIIGLFLIGIKILDHLSKR